MYVAKVFHGYVPPSVATQFLNLKQDSSKAKPMLKNLHLG